MKSVFYGRHFVDKKDVKLVSKALTQDLITTGRYVRKFEQSLKNYLKSKYILSCSSGTAAIHLALMAINLKKNDVIIMPAINFIASYNLSSYMGAKIYLADVDPHTGQMTPKTLTECIKKNNIRKIKAFITMYLGGYPEKIIEFYKLKKKFNCFLIEDACHALGAKYKFKKNYLPVGSCQHSDICTFSLHPVKTITTGEGGVVSTNNINLFKRIQYLRSHGIIRDKFFYWKYQINQIGFNYRISDINCALGISQLKKITKFVNYRKKIFNLYKKEFNKYSDLIKVPKYDDNFKPSYHLFIISINFAKCKTTKDKFLKYFEKNKIFFQYHYIPIYKFKIFNSKKIKYANSENYYKNTLSLPIYYNLNFNIQKKIIKKIKIFLRLNKGI